MGSEIRRAGLGGRDGHVGGRGVQRRSSGGVSDHRCKKRQSALYLSDRRHWVRPANDLSCRRQTVRRHPIRINDDRIHASVVTCPDLGSGFLVLGSTFWFLVLGSEDSELEPGTQNQNVEPRTQNQE